MTHGILTDLDIREAWASAQKAESEEAFWGVVAARVGHGLTWRGARRRGEALGLQARLSDGGKLQQAENLAELQRVLRLVPPAGGPIDLRVRDPAARRAFDDSPLQEGRWYQGLQGLPFKLLDVRTGACVRADGAPDRLLQGRPDLLGAVCFGAGELAMWCIGHTGCCHVCQSGEFRCPDHGPVHGVRPEADARWEWVCPYCLEGDRYVWCDRGHNLVAPTWSPVGNCCSKCYPELEVGTEQGEPVRIAFRVARGIGLLFAALLVSFALYELAHALFK